MNNTPQKNPHTIGIDLGGTKIKLGLIDHEGQIKHSLQISTDVSGGPLAIEDQIIAALHKLNPDLLHISGVGVGLAGQVDESGFISLAPNLQWHNVPFKKNLEHKIKLPVTVLNDVRAATLGEWLKGAGKGCNDLVCLFVGTGIGSGIIADGKLLSGSTGCCGEVGHMIIDWKGPRCSCGSFGCFEAHAGGWAIARLAREASEKFPEKWDRLLSKVGGDRTLITAKSVIEVFHGGDFSAASLMKHVEEALIAGCIGIVNIFNPKRLILGGGIIQGAPEMIKAIETGIKARALPAARQQIQILPSQLGDQAGVIGAGLIAFQAD